MLNYLKKNKKQQLSNTFLRLKIKNVTKKFEQGKGYLLSNNFFAFLGGGGGGEIYEKAEYFLKFKNKKVFALQRRTFFFLFFLSVRRSERNCKKRQHDFTCACFFLFFLMCPERGRTKCLSKIPQNMVTLSKKMNIALFWK